MSLLSDIVITAIPYIISWIYVYISSNPYGETKLNIMMAMSVILGSFIHIIAIILNKVYEGLKAFKSKGTEMFMYEEEEEYCDMTSGKGSSDPDLNSNSILAYLTLIIIGFCISML